MAFASSVSSSSPFTLRELVWLIGLSMGAALSAQAQSVQVAAATSLREVVVSGSRSAQDPDELPMSIDVIGP
ncbi:hypothetical protein [Rhodoferax sp.]|uniref:hypothetical protein n=1 Tax=Rhodoferax sp. TaxID=50421 RepID=UPI0025E5C412|nr:hypothetical protein [Rhodoferax sp.]